MLGQYQDTEDMVQEIFLKAYQSLSKYDPNKASFRTWLYRISSNHTINYFNSAYYRNRTTSEVNLSYLEDSSNIEEETIKDEQIKQILHAMKKRLSKKHQKIMILHFFSGLSVQEISESTNIPDKTIYKAIKSSISKIKEEVAQYE
jgi:RNA polymerase sigma-70 factor (ECF subfamily)